MSKQLGVSYKQWVSRDREERMFKVEWLRNHLDYGSDDPHVGDTHEGYHAVLRDMDSGLIFKVPAWMYGQEVPWIIQRMCDKLNERNT